MQRVTLGTVAWRTWSSTVKVLSAACDAGHRRMAQVVAYGISINLVEVTWKSKIKAQFPNPNDYSAFMGDFSSATGAVTFIMMLLSRFIFRKVPRPPACLQGRPADWCCATSAKRA